MQAQSIKITKLVGNTGQIDGLPKNPRFIRDDKFAKLVQSIKDDPEMLDLRELLVIPHDKQYVVIGGNMRLRAMIECGHKEAPCKVLDKATPPEKLRAYAAKDNVGFGEWDWDQLANEWDAKELGEWGLDIPLGSDEKQATDPVEKRSFISLRFVGRKRTTNYTEYICLFDNVDMDLEVFKADDNHALLFSGHLAQTLVKMKATDIAVAPCGDHTDKNGFHFASIMAERAGAIAGCKVHHPFTKGRTITLTGPVPNGAILVDDIVTRGRTLAAMVKAFPDNGGAIVAISNQH